MEINLNSLKKILPQLGVYRLKDLIKAIRSAKTAADERAVISKESAFIRTSFKEENVELRAINIAKLLYIHMLGYSAHFGQIECLKLVASPKFSDKRLGYLGTMMLLDENQEVLTLVTNCLKNDMNNSNMYIVSLALSTLGNISSQEMSRDLSNEVERLLTSSNAYIRKKAALCALRIIKKVPDLIENFYTRAKHLLNERTHGPLLTGLSLLIEMCALDPEITSDLKSCVSVLVKTLKGLITPGYSPEHDVNGITDPFIQVKILKLLRILGKGDVKTSEAMNDILAQVATATESSKNVGNAILYEVVVTILEIESESSLRVLAINILGKFLSNRDNNIKYVALTTLTRTASSTTAADASALQRHRSTILECLQDPDVSIRKRALDLSFYLMNGTNVRLLTRELLTFLEVCDGETKTNVSSRICEYAGRYRPSPRWEVDTVIRVLRVAGAWVDQGVVNYLVKLVTNCTQDLQQYTVKKLYQIVALEGEKALLQEGLLQALFWTMGEYGDLLIAPTMSVSGDEEGGQAPESMILNEKQILDFIESILTGPYATNYIREYAITALVKLSARFTHSFVQEYFYENFIQIYEIISAIKELISRYTRDIDMEIQQRAVEYGQLFTFDTETRMGLLERMPILESGIVEESKKGSGISVGEMSPVKSESESVPLQQVLPTTSLIPLGANASTLPVAKETANDLLDLVFGDSKMTNPIEPLAPSKDLLSDLGLVSPPPLKDPLADLLSLAPTSSSNVNVSTFGFSTTSQGSTTTVLSAIPFNVSSPLSNSIPTSVPSITPTSVPASIILGLPMEPTPKDSKKYTCFDKKGLSIELKPIKESDTLVKLTAVFEATSSFEVSNISLQVAVPKTLKLQMFPPDNTSVGVGRCAFQEMKIENPTRTAIRLRLKIAFVYQGEKVDEMAEFSSFDSSLWGL